MTQDSTIAEVANMGQFDEASRQAVGIEAGYLLNRIKDQEGLPVRFRRWLDPRTIPVVGGANHICDLVAIMDVLDQTKSVPAIDEKAEPWLFVGEIQTREAKDKEKVLCSEVANFACYAKDTDNQGGPFRPLPIVIYLTGECPQPVLDYTTPRGHGLCCSFSRVEFEKDTAMVELRKIEQEQAPWDGLFWTILMKGGGEKDELALWRRLVDEKVPKERRADVVYLALQLSELVGCLPQVQDIWKEFNVLQSTVHNETLAKGAALGRVQVARDHLLFLVENKFPGQVPDEYLSIIREHDSYSVLDEWYKAAVRAKDAQAFLDFMRQ